MTTYKLNITIDSDLATHLGDRSEDYCASLEHLVRGQLDSDAELDVTVQRIDASGCTERTSITGGDDRHERAVRSPLLRGVGCVRVQAGRRDDEGSRASVTYSPSGAPYRSAPRIRQPLQEWLIVKDDTDGPFDWLSPGGIERRFLLFRNPPPNLSTQSRLASLHVSSGSPRSQCT